MKILLLGGTAMGRRLADALVAQGHQVINSLAGRTKNAVMPAGDVRVGGFGGVAGLISYLQSEQIDAVINATHPFAAEISANVLAAGQETELPVFRLTRQSWAKHELAESWHWVPDHQSAAELARGFAHPVLLTVGRQHSLDYLPQLADKRVICRLALARTEPLPAGWSQLVAKGPFSYADELALFEAEKIKTLITKDSGGDETAAKLSVAGQLGVQVIMVARSAGQDYPAIGYSIADALDWLAKIA